MSVVEDQRDWQISELQRLLKDERATTDYLNDMIDGLNYELHQRELRLKEKDTWIGQLRQQIEELKEQALQRTSSPAAPLPPFVKLNVPPRRRKKPGRPAGHEPALRKKPAKIDRHQAVPLGTDGAGRPICPKCRCPLQRLRRRRRVVEDLVPSAVEVTRLGVFDAARKLIVEYWETAGR